MFKCERDYTLNVYDAAGLHFVRENSFYIIKICCSTLIKPKTPFSSHPTPFFRP